MKKFQFLVLLGLCVSSYASELSQSCQTCPREAYIHVASGFFSTFNKVNGNIQFYSLAKPFSIDDLIENLKQPLQIQQSKSFTLNLKQFAPDKQPLTYQMKGDILIASQLYASLSKHYYYSLDTNYVLYAIEAIGPNGKVMILGDVYNPKDDHPIFDGVLVEQGKMIARIQIKGLDFDNSDRMLQYMEHHLYTDRLN